MITAAELTKNKSERTAHRSWGLPGTITMKRILTVIMTILLITALALTLFAAPDRGKVLVVHGGKDSVGNGDKAIGERLKGLGFGTVDYIYAKDTDESSYKDYSVVFIGESVSSADVGTKFTKATCFVICGEPGLWDELLIGNYDSAYDTAPYSGKYIVKNDIVKSGLSKFDGFTKDATPGFLKEWADGVQIIAENEKGAPAVTYAAKGAKMFDGSTAVGARATFFCRGQSAADFSSDSWKMFDALVNYAVPAPKEKTESVSPSTADPTIILMTLSALTAGGFTLLRRHR